MIIRTILALLLLCSQAWAGNVVMMGGVVASVASNGLIGLGTQDSSNSYTLATGKIVYSPFTTITAGEISYAHVLITASDSDETVCVSIQQDSDSGTVYSSGSVSVSGTGWAHIPLSSFTINNGTQYRLTVQTSVSSIGIAYGSYNVTTNFTYSVNMTYSCGASIGTNSLISNRKLCIVMNNSSSL